MKSENNKSNKKFKEYNCSIEEKKFYVLFCYTFSASLVISQLQCALICPFIIRKKLSVELELDLHKKIMNFKEDPLLTDGKRYYR